MLLLASTVGLLLCVTLAMHLQLYHVLSQTEPHTYPKLSQVIPKGNPHQILMVYMDQMRDVPPGVLLIVAGQMGKMEYTFQTTIGLGEFRRSKRGEYQISEKADPQFISQVVA